MNTTIKAGSHAYALNEDRKFFRTSRHRFYNAEDEECYDTKLKQGCYLIIFFHLSSENGETNALHKPTVYCFEVGSNGFSLDKKSTFIKSDISWVAFKLLTKKLFKKWVSISLDYAIKNDNLKRKMTWDEIDQLPNSNECEGSITVREYMDNMTKISHKINHSLSLEMSSGLDHQSDSDADEFHAEQLDDWARLDIWRKEQESALVSLLQREQLSGNMIKPLEKDFLSRVDNRRKLANKYPYEDLYGKPVIQQYTNCDKEPLKGIFPEDNNEYINHINNYYDYFDLMPTSEMKLILKSDNSDFNEDAMHLVFVQYHSYVSSPSFSDRQIASYIFVQMPLA